MTSGLLIPTLRPNSDFARDLYRPWDPSVKLSRADLESSLSIGLNVAVGHHDKRGRYVEEQSIAAHSIIQQLPHMLINGMNNSAVQTVLDIGNTARTLNTTSAGFDGSLMGGANESAGRGVQCGTGTTAVTMSDYKIQTVIANGTGAGQLQWAAEVAYSVSSSGTSRLITTSRAFTNNSAGAINVTEVALNMMWRDSGGTNRQFCICRDLLSFTIGIGATKTVTYTFTVSLT